MTLIAALMALSAAYKLVQLMVVAVRYPRTFSLFYLLAPAISLTLAYHLLRGNNWARVLVALLSMLSALVLGASMLNQRFSVVGIALLAYLLFVFGAMTLNPGVLAFFKPPARHS